MHNNFGWDGDSLAYLDLVIWKHLIYAAAIYVFVGIFKDLHNLWIFQRKHTYDLKDKIIFKYPIELFLEQCSLYGFRCSFKTLKVFYLTTEAFAEIPRKEIKKIYKKAKDSNGVETFLRGNRYRHFKCYFTSLSLSP